MTIHVNSLKCVRVEVLSENTKAHLGWGSGFLCKKNARIYLVTNWHIVTSKNFQTMKPMHQSGAIPGFFNLFFQGVIMKDKITVSSNETRKIMVDLYYHKIVGEEKVYEDFPRWHEHPKLGSQVDVVVLDVTSEIRQTGFDVVCFDINDEIEKNAELGVMDNVFVTGFPLKSSTTPNEFPIYKGATIASEPDIFDYLPLFYIDGKTKQGMSGSPVIKKNDVPRQVSTPTGPKYSIANLELVGIYSGRDRQGRDEYEAELGIVWNLMECLVPILDKANTDIVQTKD